MTDLLTHVLVVYIGLTLYAWRVGPVASKYVSIAMVGAVLPDLAKINLVISAQIIQSWAGVPFSWLPLHRAGGVLAVVVVVTMLFDREYRRRVFQFLLLGAGSHLVLDALIKRADGTTPPYLYPFTWWRPPAGDLYLSSDLWPVAVSVIVVAVMVLVKRRAARVEQSP